MKYYDLKLVQEYVAFNKYKIKSVNVGLIEDWDMTHLLVYYANDYKMDLEGVSTIRGIEGSDWATPVCIVHNFDGTTEAFECWKNEKSVI